MFDRKFLRRLLASTMIFGSLIFTPLVDAADVARLRAKARALNGG